MIRWNDSDAEDSHNLDGEPPTHCPLLVVLLLLLQNLSVISVKICSNFENRS